MIQKLVAATLLIGAVAGITYASGTKPHASGTRCTFCNGTGFQGNFNCFFCKGTGRNGSY